MKTIKGTVHYDVPTKAQHFEMNKALTERQSSLMSINVTI